MSLLMKALEQAAKNREDTGPQKPAAPSTGPQTPLALEPAPDLESKPAFARDAAPEPTAAQNQAAAMFSAGARDSRAGVGVYLRNNPVLLFGLLAGVFAIGFGIYVYIEITNPGLLQRRPPPVTTPIAQAPASKPAAPPAPVVGSVPTPQPAPAPGPVAAATPEPPAAAPKPVAAVAPSAAPAAPAAAPAPPAAVLAPPATTPAPPAMAASPAAAVASTPAQPPRAAAPADTASVPRAAAAAARTRPSVARAPQSGGGAARAKPADGIAVTPESKPLAVNPTLASAYRALESARFAEAQSLYDQVVQREPRNVDALVGLAAVAVEQGNGEAAARYYMRVLEVEPNNAYAQTGMIGLVGRADPAAAESRLKQLIAREPSAFLYFTLGNVYADRSMWAQAQGAYFQAHNLQPDNPDYAFNLAVSLERISQPRIATGYYRKAMQLAQERGYAGFDVKTAEERIRKLAEAVPKE